MNRRAIALAVGVGIVVVVLSLHLMAPANRALASAAPSVTAIVRNDLGQLKWIAMAPSGYTEPEAEGRRLYLQSGCTYCHSQHSGTVSAVERDWGPVSSSAQRWGPPSEPGEYVYDVPPSFGTRDIAPDLAREGLKYSEEWDLAHFWNPPGLVQGSIMAGFSGLFDVPAEPVAIVDGNAGRTLEQNAVTNRLFDFANAEQVKLTPNADGLLFIPISAQHKYPLIWTPNQEYTGSTVKIVAETHEIQALIAYIQKLGMNRGRWRDWFTPAETDGSDIELARSDTWIAHGKQVYERRCIACHGVNGDGNGWAATFLTRQRPRNFTFGEFKFRLTKGPLPSDTDLMRTISRGVRGTAMPAWFELPLDDRLAVMQYVKYVLAADRSDPQNPENYFVDDPPGAKLTIGVPPPPTAELISHGHEIWLQAKCWECHGRSGRGDGEKAAGLKDDWGFPIRPANLTSGQFKSGPAVSDIYRTISTGLTGTPMPSFQASFSDADRWALATYILSLSAFTDPLTAAPLPISEAQRAALDDPRVITESPDRAYGLRQACSASNACAANRTFTAAIQGRGE